VVVLGLLRLFVMVLVVLRPGDLLLVLQLQLLPTS
jgi:hypothetical protein